MAGASLEVRAARFGREALEPLLSMPRHRHEQGYIAVVLAGGYQEAGNAGRFDLTAGHVVVHRPFDAHLDQVCARGARVLNLPLFTGTELPAVFRIDDPDLIARLAERDPVAAARCLVPAATVPSILDWPDRLADALAREPGSHLRSWALANSFAPETLSRGFRRAYGVTPVAFRAELRAQRALDLIRYGNCSLAAIAADCGFADQPHLTRAIANLTGHPPSYWRRLSIRFKTEAS